MDVTDAGFLLAGLAATLAEAAGLATTLAADFGATLFSVSVSVSVSEESESESDSESESASSETLAPGVAATLAGVAFLTALAITFFACLTVVGVDGVAFLIAWAPSSSSSVALLLSSVSESDSLSESDSWLVAVGALPACVFLGAAATTGCFGSAASESSEVSSDSSEESSESCTSAGLPA